MQNSKINIVPIVTLIVIILSFWQYYEGFNSEVILVRSNVDQRRYLVRNLDDKVEAANMLARLREKLKRFVSAIQNKHKNHTGIERLKIRFRPSNLTESDGNSKYTSYSVNKGQKIVFCIRERDNNNRLIDMNTITFVALHELAHVMTVSIGHTQEFWDNFKFLLKFAIAEGYYNYHPYHQQPKKYCGTMITDTPHKL